MTSTALAEPLEPLPANDIADKSPEDLRSERMEAVIKEAYGKASTLKLKSEEAKTLQERFDDADVEILPGGELYIPHMLIRERLAKAFGPGQWAMISTEERFSDNKVYSKWIMLVRGYRVGETWGGHQYQHNNPRTDLSDAMESTEGIAVRRIAAKMLNCGSQVWEPRYCRDWIASNAIKVWCKGKDGKSTAQWRRKDVPTFWNETGIVIDKKIASERFERQEPGDDYNAPVAPEQHKAINAAQATKLKDAIDAHEGDVQKIYDHYAIKSIEELPAMHYEAVLNAVLKAPLKKKETEHEHPA